MTLKSFMFWSSVLSLPFFFLPKKKQPGVVTPGPTDEDGVVLEPSDPPEPFEPGDDAMTMPAAFRNFKLPALPGYTRFTGAVPADVQSQLQPLLAGALGTVTKIPNAAGRDIVAVIEPHFHDPSGPIKPHGWHKGVTLFERKGANA